MSRYSTPLGSASASASASASESDYAAPAGRFPSNASTRNRHPLAAGYGDQDYGHDDDEDHQQDADEEEEEAWDEVDIPQAAAPPPHSAVGTSADALDAGTTEDGSTTAAGGAGIEIVIGRAPPKAKGNKA